MEEKMGFAQRLMHDWRRQKACMLQTNLSQVSSASGGKASPDLKTVFLWVLNLIYVQLFKFALQQVHADLIF